MASKTGCSATRSSLLRPMPNEIERHTSSITRLMSTSAALIGVCTAQLPQAIFAGGIETPLDLLARGRLDLSEGDQVLSAHSGDQ